MNTQNQLTKKAMLSNIINLFKTGTLMIVMTMLLLFVAMLMGARGPGLVIVFIFVLGMNFFSYWFSDTIALKMFGAQAVAENQAPDLHAIVSQLAQSAGIPKPKVYIIPSEAMNAFATGRSPSHAAVACTAGLYKTLNKEELTGVLAHEIAHVVNRDTLTQTIVACMAGAIGIFATMARWGALLGGFGGRNNRGGNPIALLVIAIVAPLMAFLIQAWISRTREYSADATGARLAGSPNGLASALQKLEQAAKYRPMRTSNATAHMFIVNPLSGGGLTSLFSTHPPTQQRIQRLRSLT